MFIRIDRKWKHLCILHNLACMDCKLQRIRSNRYCIQHIHWRRTIRNSFHILDMNSKTERCHLPNCKQDTSFLQNLGILLECMTFYQDEDRILVGITYINDRFNNFCNFAPYKSHISKEKLCSNQLSTPRKIHYCPHSIQHSLELCIWLCN